MTPNNLSQLERALLGLRSLILSGTFAQGQRLSEVKVAEQLGISRTPLRQAIERLVAEGLLERIPTGGSRIAPITYRDIADAIELRGVVEGTAARMAAERGSPRSFWITRMRHWIGSTWQLRTPCDRISISMCSLTRVSMTCWQNSRQVH